MMQRTIDFHAHPQWEDPIPQMERIIELGKDFGIERIVLLGGNLGFGFQPTADQVRQINDLTIELVRRWPEALVGFVRLSAALPADTVEREIDRCVQEGGLTGLKLILHPNARSDKLDVVMRKAVKYDIPVLHHCWYKTVMGYEGESTPRDVADLAARWPQVTIIAAHLTSGSYRGVLDLRPYPNVYYDTSGSQCFHGLVEYAVEKLGADRVVYGSDICGRDFAPQLGRIYGADLSNDERAKILYGNAARILGIED